MTDPAYIVSIPLEVVNATHRGGYYELFLKFRGEGMTTKEAYCRIEAELSAYGLPPRYTSFKSFLNNTWTMRRDLKEWHKRMSEVSTIHIP